MLVCKDGVRFKKFTPALLWMLNALYAADAGRVEGQPHDLVITSANDSRHLPTSKHYTDEALDLRSKTFASEQAKETFRALLERNLGPRFRVLYEMQGTTSEHFHCQVKRGMTFP